MASRRSLLPAALAICLIAAGIMASPAPSSAQNLLRNGDFSEGVGNFPSYWHTEEWIDLPTTQFMWVPPSGGDPGMVIIENQVENSSSWYQPVHLDPGWYYVGAEVKASCAGDTRILFGALVTLADPGIVSADSKPSADFQNLAFYLEVGPGGADVQIWLRLACFPGLKIGQARFRSASVVKVDSPPPGSKQFRLGDAREHFGGARWSMLLLALLLMIGVAAGWAILPRTI